MRLPEAQATNEHLLEEDEKMLELYENESDENIAEKMKITNFKKDENYELVKTLEEALFVQPASEVGSSFHVRFPVNSKAQTKDSPCEACSQRVEENERFEDFQNTKIQSTFHEAFSAGQQIHKCKLPLPPKTIHNLKSHLYRKQFQKTQQNHLKSHRQMKSFYEADKKHAKNQQILHCMWIFIYKTDKHSFLQKCKARLMVCGNQQARRALPTCATTLASMAFRALMAITAKFDLETVQMDAVNAFMNCKLDEVVYMKQSSEFETEKIL